MLISQSIRTLNHYGIHLKLICYKPILPQFLKKNFLAEKFAHMLFNTGEKKNVCFRVRNINYRGLSQILGPRTIQFKSLIWRSSLLSSVYCVQFRLQRGSSAGSVFWNCKAIFACYCWELKRIQERSFDNRGNHRNYCEHKKENHSFHVLLFKLFSFCVPNPITYITT